jgi:hypothetical protein
MATAGIRLSLDAPDFAQVGRDLSALFTPADKARIVKSALDKAIVPMFERLKAIAPVGPTGNLRRAVSKKVSVYSQDGNAVGVVGFKRAGRGASASAAGGKVRAGPDRAFHQWWLETGTQERVVTKVSNTPYARKSHSRRTRSGGTTTVRAHQVSGQGAVIASSYAKLGQFGFLPTQRVIEGQRVQTDPAYPRAFFRKAKKGESAIRIPAMPVGGASGEPPLRTAFEQTRTVTAEILSRELRISLEKAWGTLSVVAKGGVD